MSFAILDQFRSHRGRWRLSGMGEARIGRPIALALTRMADQD